MPNKRLIINADDFGLSHGITDGILRAHRDGIVTSTSLMANQAASEYAIAQIPNAPSLSVGVHLNICEGKPVLAPVQIPSLVSKDGMFLAPELMISKLWRCQIPQKEIEAEFRAQIRWMKDRGVTPTHADSHRHMHLYAGAILPFYRALTKEGITRARSLRVRHWPRGGVSGGPFSGSIYRRLGVGSYRKLLRYLAPKRLLFPGYCVVPHPKYRHNLDFLAFGLALVLEHLPAGSYEFGCHPGLFEAGFSENDDISARREIELEVLQRSELRSVIERNQIQLISYAQL